MSAADPFLLPLIKKCLSLSMIHPDVENWKRYIFIIPLCLNMIFMCSLAVANPILVGGVDVLQESLETLSIHFQVLMKIVIYNYYLSGTKNLMRTVEEKFWPLDSFDSTLEKRLRKKLYFVHVAYKLFVLFVFLVCMFVVLRAIFIGKTPYTIYEFINFDNIYNFFLVSIFQFFNIMFAFFCVMGIDGSFICFVVLACSQLELLQCGFAQLKFGELKTETEKEQENDKINEYVVHHNIILDFVKEIRRVYSFLILTQFTTSVLLFCSVAYMYMLDEVNIVQSIRYIIIGIANFLQLFIYSYLGQMITDTSFDVALAVYGTKWYEQLNSPRIMAAVKMIIIRSQNPIVLKAGNLYDLKFENFSRILKLSYSFYTVFRTIHNE